VTGASLEQVLRGLGYDRNDLNLDFFVESIIKQELAAITARPFVDPAIWVFTAENTVCGSGDKGADEVSATYQSLRENSRSSCVNIGRETC
jgi:hypothetical protein